MRLRREKPPAPVRAVGGVLAWAATEDGWLVGTRAELVHVPAEGQPVRLPWWEVHAADWSQDEETLTVAGLGAFRVHDAGLLLQLVRERVQASIVLQRHHPVHGRHGFRVVARRRPDGGIVWLVEYDAGVDPDAPGTVRAVRDALRQARSDVGAEPI